MKRDDEIEFRYLTRHLAEKDIDVQLDIIRRASEGSEPEGAEVVQAYAFIRDTARAAKKYSKPLQEKFGLAVYEKSKICIEIRNTYEEVKMKDDIKSRLFKQPASYAKNQLVNLFKKLVKKAGLRKIP